MNYTNKIILGFAFLSLMACQKNKPCLPPRAEIIGSNTVYTGQTLTLEAASVDNAAYSWSGPNNFSSLEQNPFITNVSSNASGPYTLKVKVGECENFVTQDVQILQGPTCAPANNTISFFSTMTFSMISAEKNAFNRYEISGNSLQGSFRIEFYGDPIAKGNFVYFLSTQNSTSSDAFMQIDVNGILANWQSLSGKLYVSVNKGKITATFCGATFGNIQSSATKSGSGKIASS